MNDTGKIVYENTLSSWDEALPLGNGRFGAMAWLRQDALVIDVNHYDVYYGCLSQYARRARGTTEPPRYPYTAEEITRRARAAHEDPQSPAHNNYNYVFSPESATQYGVTRTGAAHPLTAEVRVLWRPGALPLRRFRQVLDMSTGRFLLEEERFTLELFISQDDLLCLSVEQKDADMVEAIQVVHPDRRLFSRKVTYKSLDDETASFTVSYRPGGSAEARKVSYRWLTRARGGRAGILPARGGIALRFAGFSPRLRVVSSVAAARGETSDDVLGRITQGLADFDGRREETEAWWRRFWGASDISLPEPMLERLWYVGLYSLACANGEGARLFEQACGLNGLWDIRQPSQWGSTWYWDVNIEQSFWPIYTSNHVELFDAFSRALLSYVPAARAHARALHGLEGIASDYPFHYSLCIWAWCSQFFWWRYSYTGDREFLRRDAYPLFKEILLFFEGYLEWDDASQSYEIFPDVSPEQGPATRNSTITLASLKFLLRNTVESSRILGVDQKRRADWERILSHLPGYATGASERYGLHLKDSEWAEPDIYMAHSSPLMPIFPIGELSLRSGAEIQPMLANTIRWMEKEQNLGTHNFGWLACAYARLGDGDASRALLYEKGIALQMRPNGLFAEETERWIQNCLTSCQPVYNPPLMEAGSALAAAVNEMLLQSFGDRIELFPAVPRGKNPVRAAGRFDMTGAGAAAQAPGWRQCSFRNLRAEGGFLVSARMSNGAVTECSIESLCGNPVRLVNPFGGSRFSLSCGGAPASFTETYQLISFPTQAGMVYSLSEASAAAMSADPASAERPAGGTAHSCIVYESPSHRRVFLGKSRNTDFIRVLDSMTFDYYAGDQQVSNIPVYRFDFSLPAGDLAKDYREILERQYHGCGKMGPDFLRVTSQTLFMPSRGYGWRSLRGLGYQDRGGPDPFRRDFVSGTGKNAFRVELARGLYKVLLVTGDQDAETFTSARVGDYGRWSPGRDLGAGEFAFPVIPVSMGDDGLLEIELGGREGMTWNLSMLVINRVP